VLGRGKGERMRVLRVVAAGAVLAAGAVPAACGTSTTHAVSTTTSVSSPGVAASSTAGGSVPDTAQISDEFALAATMVLQASDLPTGWKSTDHRDTGTGDDHLDQQLGQCLGVTRTLFTRQDESAEAHSADFSLSAKNEHVANTAKIDTTVAAANRAWEPVQAPNFPTCFQQAILSTLAAVPTSGTPPKVSVGRLDFPTMLDRTSALRVTTTVSVSGFTVTVVNDYVFMQRGRVLAALTFSGGSSSTGPAPVDAVLERQLASTVARRVAKANVR
jgi:hypothetical protein